MRVIITGAAGFVGSGLAAHLRKNPAALGRPIESLVLADLSQPVAESGGRGDDRVERHCGDLTDAGFLDQLLREPVDCFFHLASVPGAAAEKDPALGWSMNLAMPIALAQRLAAQGKAGRAPRVVFASSIAVYGPLGPAAVDEDHVAQPALSYGAHKLMTEILLADLSRRGEIDARSLRLPGIVARPVSDSGHGSAFMSLLFHKAAAGEAYICPVSREATCWWMSREVCIGNLLHAARLDTAAVPAACVWQLPALHAAVGDVVGALESQLGARKLAKFSCQPNDAIEALFGRLPPLSAPRARDAGFFSDGDPSRLVANVIDHQ